MFIHMFKILNMEVSPIQSHFDLEHMNGHSFIYGDLSFGNVLFVVSCELWSNDNYKHEAMKKNNLSI